MPYFRCSTHQFSREATVIDLQPSLGQTGIPRFLVQIENDVFLRQSETVRTVAALPPREPLRDGDRAKQLRL